MDYKKLITRFRQFGGMLLVWQYAKLGILHVVVKEFLRCLIKQQSFKAIYPEVLKRAGDRGTGTCFIADRGVEINKGRGLR